LCSLGDVLPLGDRDKDTKLLQGHVRLPFEPTLDHRPLEEISLADQFSAWFRLAATSFSDMARCLT
jgi:hypothetical protein